MRARFELKSGWDWRMPYPHRPSTRLPCRDRGVLAPQSISVGGNLAMKSLRAGN